MADKCNQPKVDRKDQPCFGCGKTGHQSRDCPERKKRFEARRAPLKAIENGASGTGVCPTTGRVLCLEMPPIPAPPKVDSDGFRAVRNPVRANLASFIVPAKPKKQGSGVRFMPLSEENACKLVGCSHGCADNLDTVVADVDVDGGKPMSSNVLVVDSNSFPPIADAPKVLKRKARSPLKVDSGVERWLSWVEDDAAQVAPEHVACVGELETKQVAVDSVGSTDDAPASISNGPTLCDHKLSSSRSGSLGSEVVMGGGSNKIFSVVSSSVVCPSVVVVEEDAAANVDHSAVFGHKPVDATAKARQVASMVSALVDTKRAGQEAVLQAVVGKCGLNVDAIDALIDGTSEQLLDVPPSVRCLLGEMELSHVCAPLNLFEYGASEVLVHEAAWQDLEVEVALDSGSVCHVISEADTPCYALDSSPSARQCQEFVVGDGGTMKNFGQKKLNLTCDSSSFSSVFQIAAVHRPLMSVGRICDNDNTVTFDKTNATVTGSDGTVLCVFTRQPGGLYTAKLRLTSPFGRPEK